MLNQIMSAVEPIVISAAVAVLTAVISLIGSAVLRFLVTKKAELVQKIGVDRYNADLAVARNVWGIVDEFFRVHPELEKTVESAASKFEEEILKKIPGLTPDEIDHLRQTVAGEVNKGREALAQPAAAH